LIAISSFSQNIYPKKIILNKDSVVAITQNQVIKINESFKELDDLKQFSDSLITLVSLINESNERQINLNRKLNKKNNELLIENSELIKLNSTNDKLIDYLNKEIKNKNRKKPLYFMEGFVIGVATTSTLILIFK